MTEGSWKRQLYHRTHDTFKLLELRRHRHALIVLLDSLGDLDSMRHIRINANIYIGIHVNYAFLDRVMTEGVVVALVYFILSHS